MKRLYYIVGLAILVLLSLTVLAVQPGRAEEEPTPGVARVSLIHGDVSTMRGDSGDWVASTVNAPVVQGDKITTGERSQTEVELDYANVLRLAPATEVKIADLTRTRIQVQVAAGLVNFTVLKGSEADVEIDTPNMAVHPLREGSYRVQVNSVSETLLIVRDGEAEVSTPQGSTNVEKGHIVTVRGTDNPEYQTAEAPRQDDWDKWNKDRDHEISDARSWQYANHYYTGAHELDRNGRWVNVPGYDWCWTPYVNLGWVPYRDGSWTWEPYWGWTWVSYEPWGWAPYHYGRWFSYNDYWYWWPGGRGYGFYPTWAPAYVSFMGFGFGGRNWHFGFGFGFGSIGWLPLGPYDYHHPWWGRHNSYNVVNITNVTNVRNGGRGPRGRRQGYTSNLEQALSNGRVRGAITQASTEDFVRGRVSRNPQAVDETALRGGQLIRGTVPAVPTRESLRPVDRPVNTAALPRGGNQRDNFFTRRQPPAGPQPFAQRAAEIQEMVQRQNPLGAAGRGTALAGNANAAGATAANAGNRAMRPESAGGTGLGAAQAARPEAGQPGRGWQRFGSSAAAPREFAQRGGARQRTDEMQAQPQQPSQRPGWQRFGTGQPRAVPGRPTTTAAPQAGRGAPSGRSATPSAPRMEAPGAVQRGWNRFTPQPEGSSAPRNESRYSAPPQNAPRFSSQREAPFSHAAPRGYDRAPLDLRRSIVTPRAPQGFGGGGSRGWSAPSGGGRSAAAPPRSSGGGGRGSSAPSGGGRSAPAPAPHHGDRGGRH